MLTYLNRHLYRMWRETVTDGQGNKWRDTL